MGILEHLHRMDAAMVLGIRRHVCGIVRPLRARLRGSGVGRRIAVLQPARRRIEQMHRLIYRVQALPIGRGIAAVHRGAVVEARVPARHEVAVEVGDVAAGVCINGVVRGVRADIHHFAELFIVRVLHAQIGLRQGIHRVPVDLRRDPAAAVEMRDRAVVRAIARECARRDVVSVAIAQDDLGDFEGTHFFAVAVLQPGLRAHYILHELVHEVRVGGRVHPASVFVEALINEELSPGYGAVGVQAFLRDHVHLAAEIERGVRIDEQQGIAAR